MCLCTRSRTIIEQLLATVTQLQSEEEAADWVHKSLPYKNTLIAEFDLVESAFKDKLVSIQSMQAPVEEPAGSVAGVDSASAREQIVVELTESLGGGSNRPAPETGSSPPSRRGKSYPPSR